MNKQENDSDDTNWLDQLGGSEEGEKSEEVIEAPEEKEEVKPKAPELPKKKEPKPRYIKPEVSQKILEDIKEKLMDTDFLSAEHLNTSTCRRIHDIIVILEDNGGEWLEGRKTIDGFIINCPIYGYSPMHRCYKECDRWKGGPNPEGVCDRPMEEADFTTEKISADEAKDLEIEYRQVIGAKLASEEKQK